MTVFDKYESKVGMWIEAYNEALADYKRFPCENTENALRSALIMLSTRAERMSVLSTGDWYTELPEK